MSTPIARMNVSQIVQLAIQTSRTLALDEAKLALIDLRAQYYDDTPAFIAYSRAIMAINGLKLEQTNYGQEAQE